MICYHGSDVIVNNPRILNSMRPLDFGSGFYVTTSEQQAINWAIKVSYRNNSCKKYVTKYDFDFENANENLKIIIFDKADEKWLDFIVNNRNGRNTYDYDIVIGPVADDKVYRVVVEYENNDIDKETALKQLKTEKLCNQILFHTINSLQYLSYISVEEF